MKREVETKFFHFNQNNSGGYFIKNAEHGIDHHVVIEAVSAEDAWSRLSRFDEKIDGFFDFCQCCGMRWDECDEDEGSNVPCIYSTPIEKYSDDWFSEYAYVHYFDGTVKQFKVGKS